MGFITNQWIKGKLRSRGYFPIKVSVQVDARSTTKWQKENSIACRVEACNHAGDSQILYLTKPESSALVRSIVDELDADDLRNIAMTALVRFSDSELIKFLSSMLETRELKR